MNILIGFLIVFVCLFLLVVLIYFLGPWHERESWEDKRDRGERIKRDNSNRPKTYADMED